MHKNTLIILVSACIVIILIAGCTSTSSVNTTLSAPTPIQTTNAVPTSTQIPVTTTTPTTETLKQSIDNQLAAVNSSNPIWREAYQTFLNINYTAYSHVPYTVNETAGIYEFDCHGFVGYVLKNSDPAMYQEMGGGVDPVLLETYVPYFTSLDIKAPNDVGWVKVAHPIDLKPGDICFWRPPDPGHVFVIAGAPQVNPNKNDEVLVRVIDSVPPDLSHSHDSRKNSDLGGLGSGIIGFMTDDQGNPVAFNWKGGVNTPDGPTKATILCGRMNQ